MKKWRQKAKNAAQSLRNRTVTAGTALMLCVMTAAGSVACSYAAFGWRTQAVQTKLREIDALAGGKYVGEMDADKIADYAAVGYMTGLGDKWSSYIPKEKYQSFLMNSEGQGCGIGVSIVTKDDGLWISLVYDDSPAAQAGLQKGDCILGADGLTVAQDGADKVISAIQGDEGTDVTVTVRAAADGKTQDVTLKRAVVTQKMAWGEMLDGNVGYIRIENFHDGCAAQFKKTLNTLTEDGAQSLVIDVRHDGGGRIREMSEALDPLLPEGTIITLRTKNGKETVYTSDADCIDLPIAVLIDDQSISAAEFFAAALQEYGRATLVGTHTTGKGRAQRIYGLSDGSGINLSVETYYTPNGKSLADVGIAPDVEIALTEEEKNDFYFLTPENDPQLQKAAKIARGTDDSER